MAGATPVVVVVVVEYNTSDSVLAITVWLVLKESVSVDEVVVLLTITSVSVETVVV